MSVQLLSSTARTASEASPDQSNSHWRGVDIIINVTAVSSTPSITVTIQGKDKNVSNAYYDILVSAAITAVGTYIMHLYPGLVPATNVGNGVLPPDWRIQYTAADADSVTASVGANLLL